jgi:hypothetical protein
MLACSFCFNPLPNGERPLLGFLPGLPYLCKPPLKTSTALNLFTFAECDAAARPFQALPLHGNPTRMPESLDGFVSSLNPIAEQLRGPCFLMLCTAARIPGNKGECYVLKMYPINPQAFFFGPRRESRQAYELFQAFDARASVRGSAKASDSI